MSRCASHREQPCDEPETEQPRWSANDLIAVRNAAYGRVVDEWCEAGHYYRLELPVWGVGVLLNIPSLLTS